MKKLLLLALPLLLMLSACGWHGSGVVTGKDWRNAYTTSSLTLVGKVMIPLTYYHSADYWLHIKDSTGANHDVSVNKNYWDGAKSGDLWNNSEANK